MSKVVRFGVSIEPELMERFDAAIKEHSYTNRSEAVRDLARNWLADLGAEDEDAVVVASLMIVFDHHITSLSAKLTSLQHEDHNLVIASTHIHIDHDTCMETIVMKGPARRIRKLADAVISTRGVRNGKLWMTHLS